MTHDELMSKAISLALSNVREQEGGPFGAVVVRDGEIIAIGRNQVTESCDPSAHAEIVAIRNACGLLGTHDLSDCELYASSEPCPMCVGAIHWARLRKVYYAANRHDAARAGFDDAVMFDEVARAPEERRSVTYERLSVEDAHLPFEAWIADPNRVRY
jgi:guanine deaminase